MKKRKMSKILAILVIMLLMLIIGSSKILATDGIVWNRYDIINKGPEWMVSNDGWAWAKKVMQEGAGATSHGDEDYKLIHDTRKL